jgi:hypothetical protein
VFTIDDDGEKEVISADNVIEVWAMCLSGLERRVFAMHEAWSVFIASTGYNGDPDDDYVADRRERFFRRYRCHNLDQCSDDGVCCGALNTI